MAIYIILFIILLIISSVSIFIKINKKYSLVIFFLMALFGSLRYKIGMDYESYESIFSAIGNEPFNLDLKGEAFVEPGYAFLISSLKYIGFGSVGLFALHMIISLYFIQKAIVKYSNNAFISWLIIYGVYYANLLFNGIRQGLFIAILLYLLPILLEKKKGNFVRVLILSALMANFVHKTALFLPVIYLLCLLNPTIRMKYIILFISLIWGFSGVGDILVKIGGLSVVKESSFLSVIDFYTQSEAFGTKVQLFSISVLHRLVILMLALYFSSLSTESLLFKKISNIYFWSAILYFVLLPLGYILATRISMNIKIFDALLIPYFLIFLKENLFKNLVLLLVALWSFSMMLTNFYLPGNYPYYVPYRTILDKKK